MGVCALLIWLNGDDYDDYINCKEVDYVDAKENAYIMILCS